MSKETIYNTKQLGLKVRDFQISNVTSPLKTLGDTYQLALDVGTVINHPAVMVFRFSNSQVLELLKQIARVGSQQVAREAETKTKLRRIK